MVFFFYNKIAASRVPHAFSSTIKLKSFFLFFLYCTVFNIHKKNDSAVSWKISTRILWSFPFRLV